MCVSGVAAAATPSEGGVLSAEGGRVPSVWGLHAAFGGRHRAFFRGRHSTF